MACALQGHCSGLASHMPHALLPGPYFESFIWGQGLFLPGANHEGAVCSKKWSHLFPGAAPDAPGGSRCRPVAPGAARWLPVPPPPEAPRPVMQAPGSGRPAAELLGGFAESKVFCRPGLRQVLGGRSGMRVYTGCSPTAGHYDGLPTSGANRPWKWANPGWPLF